MRQLMLSAALVAACAVRTSSPWRKSLQRLRALSPRAASGTKAMQTAIDA